MLSWSDLSLHMPGRSQPKPLSAVVEDRRRLGSHGLKRIEVQVHGEDAPLVRAVAAALADPGEAGKARAVPPQCFVPAPTYSLKGLLAAAPLADLDLTRSRCTGRAADL